MTDESPRDLGRYVLYDPIASGGMATVHFGRIHGAVGFSRLVAIKRLHRNYVSDPSFVQMFLDEARLAARLDHPNVVKTLDVVADETEVFLVMEYVLGDSLEALMAPGTRGSAQAGVPLPIASAILCGMLEGLHSAHEAKSDRGEPLGIVHRDVSPHNVLVGVDGVARIFDFGIAKAAINTQETREGVIKGKVTYMAPEQVWGQADRRADIYAAGVILWELVAGRRRHAGERNDALFLKLAKNDLPPLPPCPRPDAPGELDEILARATASRADDRFPTAREMAVALERAVPPAPARDVAVWLREAAGSRIELRTEVMRRIEAQVQQAKDSRPTLADSLGGSTATLTRAGVLAREPSVGTQAASPRRAWVMPAVMLLGLAGLGFVAMKVLARPGVPPPDAGEAPVAAAPAAPPPVVSEEPPAPRPAPVPAPVASSAASVAAAPSPAPRPVWTPPPRTTRTAEPAPAATSVTASAPAHKPSCETPFVIGPDGIRQVKPECL